MANILRETVSADGNSTAVTWESRRKDTPNRGTVWAYGTFGGGTASLEASPDGGTTWVAILDQSGTAITFTANGVVNFELYADQDPIAANKTKIRLTLAGATAPTLNYIINNVN